MTIQEYQISALVQGLRRLGGLNRCFMRDAEISVALSDLLDGSMLYGRGEELAGKSVLIATKAQLTTIAALIELDGVARRVVLCPPDLALEHFPYVIETADVDAIVSDRAPTQFGKARAVVFMPCSRTVSPRVRQTEHSNQTEWVLLTSGTTGLPKLVPHTFASLTAAIRHGSKPAVETVWSTFYDIRRYGGLQILLRAALTGTSLVLSSAEEHTGDFLARAGSCGVTHISGTPSHWRRVLMSSSIQLLQPSYVRLSGEAVDQAILDQLRAAFPQAQLVHAFASTEAGVGFEVKDGRAGFPVEALTNNPRVEMKIEDSTLRIRSAGCASRYLGDGVPVLRDEAGFVDTHDVIESREGRCYFAGRYDGVINVGGLKVHPEQVEAVISQHPDVQMCLVRARKSPVTGALVMAEVVLRDVYASRDRDARAIQENILAHCRSALPPHKVPALIKIVPSLALSGAGKVMRRDA